MDENLNLMSGILDVCPSCGMKTTYRAEELLSSATVRGKFFVFCALKAYCEVCGMPVFVQNIETENSRRQMAEYSIVSQ